ncbi:MAG: hypothetical protein RL722_1021 [Pseudomonadota bacterium]
MRSFLGGPAGLLGRAVYRFIGTARIIRSPSRAELAPARGVTSGAPAFRGRRLVALLAGLGACLLASGCSTLGLAYGQAPTLAYWWADRYVDFDAEQSRLAKAALQDWAAWHRRAALAEDIALLERSAELLRQPELEARSVCAALDEVRARRPRYLEPLMPALLDIAGGLSPRQLDRIAQRQAEANKTWREEHLQPRADERLEADVKRILDYAEDFYGRLDGEQRRYISTRVAELSSTASASASGSGDEGPPWDGERWYADRLSQQQRLLKALRDVAGARMPEARGAAREALARQLSQPEVDAATLAWRRRLEAVQCRFVAELHQRTTAAQHEQAVRRLRGWAKDLRAYLPANLPASAGSGGSASAP